MAYEVFPNKAARLSSPQLTISSGRIIFNASAGDILSSAGMGFAHLLLDADKGKFAVRLVKRQDENTFAVSFKKGRRNATITANSFLNHLGWHAEKPVTIDVQWNPREAMMEASLPKEHVGPLIRHTPTDTRRRGTKHEII